MSFHYSHSLALWSNKLRYSILYHFMYGGGSDWVFIYIKPVNVSLLENAIFFTYSSLLFSLEIGPDDIVEPEGPALPLMLFQWKPLEKSLTSDLVSKMSKWSSPPWTFTKKKKKKTPWKYRVSHGHVRVQVQCGQVLVVCILENKNKTICVPSISNHV